MKVEVTKMNIRLEQMDQPKQVTLTYDVSTIQAIDVIDIQPVNVTYEVLDQQTITTLRLHIQAPLVLACAKTLKPVHYFIETDEDVTFGDIDDADFIYEPHVDLSAIVLGIIMSEKPFAVYHDDADQVEFIEEKGPSPFEALLKK
jgi:uncharacterized metal-binding protein YceD (DUF177 family)